MGQWNAYPVDDFQLVCPLPDKSSDSGPLGKGNQFRERLDLHLLHHPVAMGLDRALSRTQYVGDLLVGLAANDEFEDFSFARRQLRNMSAHDVELVSLATRCLMVAKARSIAPRSSSDDTGLVRKSSAPALMARTVVWTSA